MVAENMITLNRRAVFSLFMTRNRLVDKEMFLVRLAIVPEFDLVDDERQVKQLLELYKSGVHTTVRNTLRATYC